MKRDPISNPIVGDVFLIDGTVTRVRKLEFDANAIVLEEMKFPEAEFDSIKRLTQFGNLRNWGATVLYAYIRDPITDPQPGDVWWDDKSRSVFKIMGIDSTINWRFIHVDYINNSGAGFGGYDPDLWPEYAKTLTLLSTDDGFTLEKE